MEIRVRVHASVAAAGWQCAQGTKLMHWWFVEGEGCPCMVVRPATRNRNLVGVGACPYKI